MKCANCGAEIGAGLKFCTSCGAAAPTARSCPNCGAEIAGEARFCANCGTPAASPLAAAQSGPPPAPTQSPSQQPPVPQPPPGPAPSYQQTPYQPPPYQGTPNQPGWQQPPLPAAPALAFDYKGIGPRLGGFAIDVILFFVFSAILASFLGSGKGSSGSSGVEFNFNLTNGPALLAMFLWGAYHVVMEGYFGGTVDKLVLGMRIVNARGEHLGLGPAFRRNVLRIVDFLPMFYILGAVFVATSATKQRMGDRVAGSYVVSTRTANIMSGAAA